MIGPTSAAVLAAVERRARTCRDRTRSAQRHHRFFVLTLVAAGLAVCVACTSGHGEANTTPSRGLTSMSTVRSTTPPSDRGSESPTASADAPAAAISAYHAFSEATFAAERSPGDASARLRLSGMSFDPARGNQLGYIVGLASQGVAWRGSPAVPRVAVLSVNLGGKPWPSVTLGDCPTPAPSWQEYVVKTGAVVSTVPSNVAPPYQITIEMIFNEGRWGVRTVAVDRSNTCSAP